MQDQIQEFSKLKASVQELSSKKIRLEERYKNEKDRLEKLVKEISDRGYDPKKLAEIRKQKTDELTAKLTELREQITDVQSKLTAIEVA